MVGKPKYRAEYFGCKMWHLTKIGGSHSLKVTMLVMRVIWLLRLFPTLVQRLLRGSHHSKHPACISHYIWSPSSLPAMLIGRFGECSCWSTSWPAVTARQDAKRLHHPYDSYGWHRLISTCHGLIIRRQAKGTKARKSLSFYTIYIEIKGLGRLVTLSLSLQAMNRIFRY